MILRKEVHFNHEGQDYFVSLPMPRQGDSDNQYNQVLDLLQSHGIQQVYIVDEDAKGRYTTILVNKSLSILVGAPNLTNGVELRTGHEEPYLYLAETLTIFQYWPVWLDIVDQVWKNNNQ